MNGQYWYNTVFKPTLEAAKIPVDRPDGIVWHTLRHTFGSRVAMLGGTERDLMELGRWKTSSMVKRYTHLTPTHLRGTLAKLSEFGQCERKEKEEAS